MVCLMMESITKFISRVVLSSANFISKRLPMSRSNKDQFILYTTCGCIASTSLALYATHKYRKANAPSALLLTRQGERSKAGKMTGRKRHFIKFASVEYNGQLFMTPQDFLDALVEQEPKTQKKRRTLGQAELKAIKEITPSIKQGSTQLFRSIGETGIISYSECLFLLSVITSSRNGFKIAFDMFDKDGNKKVTKCEYLTMEKIFSSAAVDHRSRPITNTKFKKPKTSMKYINDEYRDDVKSLPQHYLIDTTLLLHFFGKDGRRGLRFDEFDKFANNLQTEVLEVEFQKFSEGKKLISEVDFAKIMLRYTNLDTNDYNDYMDRLLYHLTGKEGIPFSDFRVFCQFLNNIEDFAIAMKIYKIVNDQTSQEEFHHAVKVCTGAHVSRHIVNTVFLIFDKNGDGQLSYEEFVQIMKDRIYRGFKSYGKTEGWQAFKTCLNREMKVPP